MHDDVTGGQLHGRQVRDLDVRGGQPSQHLVEPGHLGCRWAADGHAGALDRNQGRIGRGEGATWPAVPEPLTAGQCQGREHACGQHHSAGSQPACGRGDSVLASDRLAFRWR